MDKLPDIEHHDPVMGERQLTGPERSPAEWLIGRETRVAHGPVPHRLLDRPLAEMSWQFDGDEFLFRALGEHYFHYRRGRGIIVERGGEVDPNVESLCLNGSVYAAVASFNGLVPIHASAVASGGKVFAFTAPAGGGKSTLVAGLGDRGLPMFCDDTLVLDLSDAGRITCLPGHKRLKLTADGLALTHAAPEERVATFIDKSYAKPSSGIVDHAMPLAELIFLDTAADPQILPITGFERFTRLCDDHYTGRLYAGAQGLSGQAQFEHLARLAARLTMTRLVRPLEKSRFEEVLALVGTYIIGGGNASQSVRQ
jgi:hypothetical protein